MSVNGLSAGIVRAHALRDRADLGSCGDGTCAANAHIWEGDRHMKMRVMALMLALLMALMCVPALADGADDAASITIPGVSQSDMENWPIVAPAYEAPDFSGTADWPVFRGLQWSMDENVVVLLEQGRGVELEQQGEGDIVRAYRASAPVEVLGYEASALQYEFSDDMGLCRIVANIPIEGGEAECTAALEAVTTGLVEVYGEPLEREALAEGWSEAGDGQPAGRVAWGRPIESAQGAGNGAWYAMGSVSASAMSAGGAFNVMIELSGGAYIWQGN